MKIASRTGSTAPSGSSGSGSLAVLITPALKGIAITGVSGGLLWFVWIYASGLRDPRFLDGWILAGGVSLQLYLHIARRLGRLSPRSALRWRRAHIRLGYLLIVVFLSHSEFSLPDSIFEWSLWCVFVLLASSGIFGTYLAWAMQRKHDLLEGIAFERIPHLCAGLAEQLHSTVHAADPAATLIPLPPLPHEDWIKGLL